MSGIRARVVRRHRVRDHERLVFDHERISGADFSGRRILQLSAQSSRFEACRFDRLQVDHASFGSGRSPSVYTGCSFDGARLRAGAPGHARFVGCSFREVDLRDWFCFTVELVDCVFTGKLTRSFFNGTVPEDAQSDLKRTVNEFRGNDFRGLTFIDVGFRTGINLLDQLLPEGANYVFVPDAAVAIQRARSRIVHWEDGESRRQAMIWLQQLEYDVDAGQRQLFLNRADERSVFGDALADRLVAALDESSEA
jgi:hypothetical protein